MFQDPARSFRHITATDTTQITALNKSEETYEIKTNIVQSEITCYNATVMQVLMQRGLRCIKPLQL